MKYIPNLMFLSVYFGVIMHVSTFILVCLLFLMIIALFIIISCSHFYQNGVAERKTRHLLEVTCAISFYMHVPKSY